MPLGILLSHRSPPLIVVDGTAVDHDDRHQSSSRANPSRELADYRPRQSEKEPIGQLFTVGFSFIRSRLGELTLRKSGFPPTTQAALPPAILPRRRR